MPIVYPLPLVVCLPATLAGLLDRLVLWVTISEVSLDRLTVDGSIFRSSPALRANRGFLDTPGSFESFNAGDIGIESVPAIFAANIFHCSTLSRY